MNLAELGKELEKDKRGYNSALLANYNDYDFYVVELLYDDKDRVLYFLCEDELIDKSVSPKEVIKEYKKKYKNDYKCVMLNMKDEFTKNISYIGFRNGDGNFGEFDHKILY